MLGPNHDIEAMIARRRAWGADRFDEVWNGEYHVAPYITGEHALVSADLTGLLHPFAEVVGLIGSTAFNLGDPTNFRVPDLGYHRERWEGWGVPTAAVVVEVVLPDDETYAKFDFYARHGVEEIIVADPAEHTVRCFGHTLNSFHVQNECKLLGISSSDLTAAIDWPGV